MRLEAVLIGVQNRLEQLAPDGHLSYLKRHVPGVPRQSGAVFHQPLPRRVLFCRQRPSAWPDRTKAAGRRSHLRSPPVGCRSTGAAVLRGRVACSADAAVRDQTTGHFGESERFVKFSVGQQPSVGGDLAAQKLELQAAVETEPQITVLAVTHWVPPSGWHVESPNPCLPRT